MRSGDPLLDHLFRRAGFGASPADVQAVAGLSYSAAVDYFVHPTDYDTTNATTDLAGSGIAAPRLRDYAPRLVEFARAHPEIGSAAMV